MRGRVPGQPRLYSGRGRKDGRREDGLKEGGRLRSYEARRTESQMGVGAPGSPVAHVFSAGVMHFHYDEDMLEV